MVQMLCIGAVPYVRGLDDGITLLDTDYCASDGLTNGQLEKILLKFIKDNPAKAHFATVVLFMGAVEAAFPCPKK
jgi:hypothetical protein